MSESVSRRRDPTSAAQLPASEAVTKRGRTVAGGLGRLQLGLKLERVAAERLLTALTSGDDTTCLPPFRAPGG
jgi:hypothetical protein